MIKRTKKVAPAKPKRTSIVIPQDDDEARPMPATPAAPAVATPAARVPRYYENVQEEEEGITTTSAELGEVAATSSSPGNTIRIDFVSVCVCVFAAWGRRNVKGESRVAKIG